MTQANKPDKPDQPDKPYDNGWKRLLDVCAQDLLSWMAGDVTFTGRRSEEFESTKIDADLMLEACYDQDKTVMIHIEAQSTPDHHMAHRLLVYNALAHRRYKCPVISYVIYLRKGGERPSSPLLWSSPNGREILRFHYEDIELPNYTPEALFATGLRGIFPLIPFSADGARREVIEEIITRLLPVHDTIGKELVILTRLFASLAFGKKDQANQEWLMRRFAMLQDMFRDTPAFQQIFAEGKEEGITLGIEKGIAQGKEEGIAQGKEEGIVLGIERGIERGMKKGFEKGRQEERQETLQTLRQTLLTLTAKRFPKLKSLANGQLLLIEQPQILEDLFLKIALAHTQEEAQDYLLTWDVQSGSLHS